MAMKSYVPPLYSVVYNRVSTNPFWIVRRNYVLESVPESFSLGTFDTEAITSYFRAAAEAEEAKENDFLAKFYHGTKFKDGSNIDKFNELF